MISNILITGSTGNLGSEVVKKISGKEFHVKATVRDLGKYHAPEGVETVLFDYDKPETFNDALSNVDGILLVAPSLDPFADGKLNPFIDKAVDTGVNHIILNTAFGIDMAPEAALYKVEQHLIKSGCDYNIIRPNFFMENFSKGFISPMIIHSNAIYLAAGDSKTSFISVVDIAASVVEIFTNPDAYKNKAFNLTGPKALDHNEVVSILNEKLGKNIQYIAISSEDMKKGAIENGMPEPSSNMLCALYDAVSAGYMAAVTSDVKNITGKDPINFQEFVEINKDCWK